MKFVSSLIAVGVLAASCGRDNEKVVAPQPTQVDVEAVQRVDVPLFLESVASVDGYVNADIRARVRGYLRTQNYRDGATVKQGDLLFTIEATEFQAQVASAKASVARAKAAKELAELELVRMRKLREMNAIPQQQLDTAMAAAADTEGQVEAAEAALAQATLSLSYTQIRSPVIGVAGIATVRVGNLVGQNEPTLLTTVSQVEPMRVRFPISEVDYLKQPEKMAQLAERDLKWAQAEFAKAGNDENPDGVQLILSDGRPYKHRGALVAVDRNVDPTTGTIQVEALFPNPEGLLKPGQFGRVRIRRTEAGNDALVVSQRALTEVQGAFTVAVVTPDNVVSIRKVGVGAAAGDKRIVLQGLVERDRVIVSGIQKVKDGVTVQANDVTAAADPPSAGASQRDASGARADSGSARTGATQPSQPAAGTDATRR